MREMIRTLHYAIETGKEESGLELVSFFFAVLMSIVWFITLLYSFGDCTHEPGSVDYFLTHNKWISFTGCITIVLGWVFYCQYDKMREYWVKTPDTKPLAYFTWYVWYVLTYSWIVIWPIYLTGWLINLIFVDSTIWFVKRIRRTFAKKPTMFEQYNEFLSENKPRRDKYGNVDAYYRPRNHRMH